MARALLEMRAMGKRDKDVIRYAADHVFALFRDASRESALVYHGYDRTRELVRSCREIGKGCGLEDAELRVALLAAWFYDVGRTAGPQANGVQSAEIARQFLAAQGEPAELADAVEACMRASHDGVVENGAQEVLHDALLVPTAGKDYLRELQLLRCENNRRAGTTLSDVEWTEGCIQFVEQHPFRTRYAQVEYNRGRAENLVRLQNLLREQRERNVEEKAEAAKGEKRFAAAIEELYKDLTRNQFKLLAVADRRTATMVHVNAIMISLIVALLLRHIDTHPHLLVPTLLLLAVNLAAVLISILSMRAPSSLKRFVDGGGAEDAAAHDTNLLLIGNNLPMARDAYREQMEQLAQDLPALRKSMLDATYFVRRMLVWRAKMLRATYDVFLGGLFLAVFAFVVAVLRK
ncbi:MAG TPA: Pycsar system effector family protein [Myxococcales bacterium]|nr:Pycsar system effector family protein [Myxococcales bacterium]